jgi:hypothetical protein
MDLVKRAISVGTSLVFRKMYVSEVYDISFLNLGLLILSRFQNLKHNFAIVDALTAIATRKGITAAQLSIAWVSALGPHVVPLPGSSCVLILPLKPVCYSCRQ